MRGLTLVAFCVSSLVVGSAGAQAKGCIKGAIIGGIAGHLAGHGLAGAAAGCVAGRASSHYMGTRAVQPVAPTTRRVTTY